MDSRVRTFNCDYRAAGNAGAPGPLELEHDLRAHFAPAFAERIDLALDGDPTVYVIRRVDCELTVRRDDGGLPVLIGRIAAAVTNAVLRTLSEAAGTDALHLAVAADVAVFCDEAEFLAQFLIDLLEDRAASRWYYDCFADAVAQPRSEALAALLCETGPGPLRALGRIFARGYLERLLSEVGPSVRARLAGSEATAPDELVRPLLNAALALVRDAGGSGGSDPERVLGDYVATGPPGPDWRDRVSLAVGVLDALKFLLGGRWGGIDAGPVGERMLAAGAALDWLDTPTLLRGIERLVSDAARPAVRPAAAHGAARLSARQRLILSDLAAACASGWPAVEVGRGDCAENRLRLRAALSARAERWADDPVAGEMIGALLREMAPDVTVGRPLLRELAMRGVAAAEQALARYGGTGPGLDPEAAMPASAHVTSAGPRSGAADGTAGAGTYSEHAGVALLIRAALDLRLDRLASRSHFLPAEKALASALTALGGGFAAFDPGLDLILGAPALRAQATPGGEPARRAFELNILRALGARGLLDGEPRIVMADVPGARVMFGGIERPAVWPLTKIVSDPAEVAPTLVRWRRQWMDATGVDDASLEPADDRESPTQALEALLGGSAVESPAQLTAIATGLTLVRAWGRWLPGLDRSSLPYLLNQFIRRPGTVRRDGEHVRVALDRRALDPILEISGALTEIDARRSLGVTIRFELAPG